MANQSQSHPFLVVSKGPRPNQAFPLNKTVLTIGRSRNNDIVINENQISRHHARLTYSQGQWILEDLGSRNGTFINGQRITGPTYLAPDSQIGFGPNVSLEIKRSAPAARPRRKASRQKSKISVLATMLGLGLIGIIVLGVLGVAAYFYFSPSPGLPFGLSQAESNDILAGGPTVVIQQPQPGVQVNKGDAIFFSANAMDDGGVVRIDLWVGDQIVLSQTSPDENGTTPFSLNYPLVATELGSYALVARAYNSQGLMGESPAHYVNVAEAEAVGGDTADQELGQYVVQEGDTLESIARRADTTAAAILAANPGLTADQVKPGQVIIIPLPKPTPLAPAPQQGGQQAGQQGGQQGGQQSGQQGGQQAGGQQGVQQQSRPAPANPSNTIAVKSATVNPSPVYYGKSCTNQATVLNVTAKVEPTADVSKVILAYAFTNTAGVKSQDVELAMQLSGGEYKAAVDVGKQAEAHFAQTGGKLEVRVEAYDKNNKLSYSPIYTATVVFCKPAAGIQPGGLPGVNFMPNPVPNIGNIQVVGGGLPGVVVNPGPGAAGNPNPRMQPPDPVQATVVDECQVKITWSDNTNNETDFAIARRYPGQPADVEVAYEAANSTEYTGSVPEAGKHEYRVTATQVKNNKVVDYATSQAVVVDVPATPGCQDMPNLMRMFLQPVEFNAPGYAQGFVDPVLDPAGAYLIFRLPQEQGKSIPVSEFGSDKYRIVTWLSESRAGLDIILSLVGNGVDQKNKPFNLGSFSANHTYQELTGPNRQQVYQNQGKSQHGSFDFKYKFWLEPWQWGAVNIQSSPVLKPPTNFQMKVVGGEHQLTWDYEKDILNKYVSGFNIYREYFCPGYQYSLAWPMVVPRGILPANNPLPTVSYSERVTQMPRGCSCWYQVSAFGQGGESDRADLQNLQDCFTFTPNDSLTVTFEDVEISNQNLPKAKNAHVYLWANYFGFSTDQKVLLTSGKHAMDKIDFGSQPGVQPGDQPMIVGVGQNQSLQLGFYLGGICKSSDLILKPPAGGSWSKVDQDFTVSSADGSCKMTVHVTGSAVGQPGGQPGGQPPQQGGQQGGAKCSGPDGCTVVFVNGGSHPITSLKIGNDPKNIVNVIKTLNDIILPGGSFPVKNFKDVQYVYSVEYGFIQNQQVVLLLPGPAGTLNGIDSTVIIKDPTARQLLSTYQVVASWSGPDILNNFACHRFDFYENGTFEFFINGQKSDSGTYATQVQRNPGVYGITFNIIGKNYKFPNGTYYYAGPMAGLLYVDTGRGQPAIVEYVQKQSCLGP